VTGIDRVLGQARQCLVRVDPHEAQALMVGGALLVDIRPVAQRAEFGEVPGALIVERNVLEWRFDPDAPYRNPQASDGSRPVIVMCQEGYASSLAAASLLEIGRTNVTDLDGGFVAWQAAGLPTILRQNTLSH
jgi:rhodanese-related sulfurtransferase